jgi:NAD(P)H-flavin reductase
MNPYLPRPARIEAKKDESPDIFTWRLQLADGKPFTFMPGQVNMLYLYGVGEVPISIVSDPEADYLDHTIRAVGRVTKAMQKLSVGQTIGMRGPYGRGWPVEAMRGKDVMVVTGGIGCAPVVSVIEYVLARREDYGRLIIMQGVKHSDDLIYRDRYDRWAQQPNVQVLLAADVATPGWRGVEGPVTVLLDKAQFDPQNVYAVMCGPEPMMTAVSKALSSRGVDPARLFLSMERNMQCMLGHCGHCQIGPYFVCRDGPVFSYVEIAPFLGKRGF